jgi:hypothetical protein
LVSKFYHVFLFFLSCQTENRGFSFLRFECIAVFSGEIAKLFPNVYGQPSAMLVPSNSDTARPVQKLKIGVVLSGGQAPGGHNVISGIFGGDPMKPIIPRRFVD